MKTGIMLMSDRGPDGQPWDWRKALERWKGCGLESVDLFDRMLTAVGETVPGVQRLLNGPLARASIACRPTWSAPTPRCRAALDTIRRGIEACGVLACGSSSVTAVSTTTKARMPLSAMPTVWAGRPGCGCGTDLRSRTPARCATPMTNC